MFVFKYIYRCEHGGWRSMLGVFLYWSPLYSLRQNLLLNLELTDSARQVGQRASEILHLCPLRFHNMLFCVFCFVYMDTGNRSQVLMLCWLSHHPLNRATAWFLPPWPQLQMQHNLPQSGWLICSAHHHWKQWTQASGLLHGPWRKWENNGWGQEK